MGTLSTAVAMTISPLSTAHAQQWFCGSASHIGTISFSTLMSAPGPVVPLTDPETYMRQKLTEAMYNIRGLESSCNLDLHRRAIYHCTSVFTAAVHRKKHYFLQNGIVNVQVPSVLLNRQQKESFLKDLVGKMFHISTKTLRAAGLCIEAAEGRLGLQFRFHSAGFRIPDTTALKIMLASLKIEVNDVSGNQEQIPQGYTQAFSLQVPNAESSTSNLQGCFSRDAMLKTLHPMYHCFVPTLSNNPNGEGLCSQVATKVRGGSTETWLAHVHQPSSHNTPLSLRNASTLALVQACLSAHRAPSSHYPRPFHPYQ
ncbi:ORF22 [Psittacine aviadenovirus B]|uniref:ORF22 n=1 Tax=psittacine adenovirus 4 TaxID=2773287 RepID=A0A1P8SW96_9ADEN|nr:ORF22 [Psittacine aviadenovirus B]APY28372.1 ORF22 [psittacine adenovirus 4]